MDRSRIGLVIPAFNEAGTITKVINVASEYGRPIVVDDGSFDDTAELARQAGAIVVSHPANQGYDSALNSGFAKAAEIGSEVIVTLDADGQHDPALLRHFIGAIETGADVVIGIRSRRYRLAENLFAVFTKWRFGIEDPLCGMKAYRRLIYEKLGYFDSYQSIGTELLLYSARHHYKIHQIHFHVGERMDKPRFGSLVVSNYRIIRALIISALRFW